MTKNKHCKFAPYVVVTPVEAVRVVVYGEAPGLGDIGVHEHHTLGAVQVGPLDTWRLPPVTPVYVPAAEQTLTIFLYTYLQ